MIEEGEATSGVASGSSESDGPMSVEPVGHRIGVVVLHRRHGGAAGGGAERESLGPHWLVPGIEIALLVALIAANPLISLAVRRGSARWRSR